MYEDFFNKYDAEKAARERASSRRKRTVALDFVGIVEIICVAFIAVIIFITLVARHSPVYGASMEPTLNGAESGSGDVLLISGFGYKPAQGDIVIIQTEIDPAEPYIKRVIAVGGQKLKIDFSTWSVWVDGVLIETGGGSTENSRVSYLVSRPSDADMYAGELVRSPYYSNGIYEKTIDAGNIFVMGDNRNNSKDSRSIGEIDARRIVGEAKFRLLPTNRFGKIK